MSIDFRGIASAALSSAHELVPRWLPDGRSEANEWIAANPRRPGSDGGGAFRVNLHSGAWADFAGDGKGRDLVSLRAYIDGTSNGVAAKVVAAELGIDAGGSGLRVVDGSASRAVAARPRSPDGEIVVPAPADAPAYEPTLHHFRLGKASRSWAYRDAQGRLLMVVARFDAPAGKEIMPYTLWRSPTGGLAWRAKGLPKPWPLYQLDELARRPDATVMVCEGEKAADACQRLLPEFVATTSPSGSKNASRADWSPLAGRRVLIWPDHDVPGIDYADAVREQLLAEGAASIQVLSFAWVARELATARMGGAA